MKKIVIIGANDFQNPLIIKAKEMGYETHVFAWRDGSIGEKTADFFYPISIVEKEQISEQCRKIKPDAIATIASDLANITVQYAASRLGLPTNSDQCIKITTNKFLMRKALKAGGVKTPLFTAASDVSEIKNLSDFTFPVIVKPTDRSGSRGITKVESPEQLQAAIEQAKSHSFEKLAIVEECINGPEYSCECISYNGIHTMLAITKKYTTGSPHYIETGHLEPAPLTNKQYKEVQKTVFAALDALQIKQGASHTEFRISPEGEIGIIEAGSRMGGDCIGSHLVHLSTGMDFVKMVIEVASGLEPTLTPESPPQSAAIRFIFTQQDIDVLENIRSVAPEALHFVSDIQPLDSHEIVDSGSRLGFYIIKSQNTRDSLELLKL